MLNINIINILDLDKIINWFYMIFIKVIVKMYKISVWI